MNPLKKIFCLFLGLMVLATAAVLVTTSTVGAQNPRLNPIAAAPVPSVPVSVVNTPLPVQGTVDANLTNSLVPVTGSVSVNSLPAVQLSGTQSVNVSTTSMTPLYVDADRPARNGFNASCFTGNVDPTSGQAQCTLLTVPGGREVVIESISCQAELFAGEGPGDVQLIVPNVPFGGSGVTNVSHLLALSKQAGSSTVDIWRMTTPLRAYASAPSAGSVDISLFFRANPASPPPQGLLCTISGYAVGQ